MYEKIRERYMLNYIRDDQLDRYVVLKCISQKEAEALKAEKSAQAPPDEQPL